MARDQTISWRIFQRIHFWKAYWVFAAY